MKARETVDVFRDCIIIRTFFHQPRNFQNAINFFFARYRNELYNPLCSNKGAYKLCFKYLARKKNPKVVPSSKLGSAYWLSTLRRGVSFLGGNGLIIKRLLSPTKPFLVIAFHATIDLLSILRAPRSRNRIYGRFHG